MRTAIAVVACGIGMLLTSAPASAHHRKPIMNWCAAVEPAGFISPQFRRASFEKIMAKARTTAMSEIQTEKRASPRYKVLKGATIAFGGNGAYSLDNALNLALLTQPRQIWLAFAAAAIVALLNLLARRPVKA